MKKILLFLVALFVATKAFAYEAQIDGIYYNFDHENKTATVTNDGDFDDDNGAGYTQSEIIIPEKVRYNGVEYSVTSIGASAFRECTGLTSIEIPNSVILIGNYFSPGSSAFKECTGLTSIEVDNDNQNYASVDGVLYDKNITTVICCPQGKTSIEIPNSVTEIGECAFEGCTGLTSIEIPNSVTEIGMCAFEGFTGLTSIEIPNSVTRIGTSAFEGCTRLTSIEIPNSVTRIGNRAFEGCIGLTSITIGENVTSIDGYDSFYGPFMGCDNLNTVVWNAIKYSEEKSIFGSSVTSITIGENVTSIERKVFEDCSNLTTVVWNAIKYDNSASGLFKGQITSFTFGNKVEHIPYYLCGGKGGLTSIIIPESVTEIGESAFEYCTGLTSIEIPNSVTSIGKSAFYGCTKLTSVIIGNGVTEIDETIFYNCTGLTSIVIGKGVTSIDKDAFKDCSSLASVNWNIKKYNDFSSNENLFASNPITSFTFGDNVEYIPAYICYNMTNLNSIVIPNLVTEIGESAFEGCGKLRTVEIGKSITSIEGKAFAGCTAIYSMGVDAIIPPIVEASTFENVSRTTQIKVPCGAMVAYQASSYWNEFTNYIESPNTLSVEVNDNTMGMAVVTKQNTCTDITATVQAQARPGYEFVKWSDGFTENPHTVFVMEDMTITAEFAKEGAPEEDNENRIFIVESADETQGNVIITITANAIEGFEFSHWSDGNTENPRIVTLDTDVELYAYFKGVVTGLEKSVISSANVYGNNGILYAKGVETDYHVLDAAGRLIYTGRDAQLSLPRGVYVVVVGDEVEKVVL